MLVLQIMPTSGRFSILNPLPFLLTLCIQFATATPNNYTIDDTFGDSRTGQQVIYQPTSSPIWATQNCVGCTILPDASNMMNGTDHSNTWIPGRREPGVNITIHFSGTAIYVFFTLIDSPMMFPPSVITTTAVKFTLGQAPPIHFQYVPKNGNQYLFQSLVFAHDHLTEGNHTLVIAGDPGPKNEAYYINFDYAMYTHQDSVNVLPSSIPASGIISASNAVIATSSAVALSGSGQWGTSSTTLENGPFSTHNGNKSPSELTLPLSPPFPPSSRHPSQKIGIILGSAVGGTLCMTAFVFLTCGVYRRQTQHSTRQLVPFTHQVQANNERTLQYLLPSKNQIGSPNQNDSTIHATRIARQEALKQRLIMLEQEMQEVATALSTPETEVTGQKGRLPTDRDDDLTLSELRGRASAMRTQAAYLMQQRHSDWAEGLTDELPPGYTVDDEL